MKFPKPFFRKSKGAWYVQLGKRQISLGKDREEAFRRYRELLLHEQGKPPERNGPLTTAQVCDLFLERRFPQSPNSSHVKRLEPGPGGVIRPAV